MSLTTLDQLAVVPALLVTLAALLLLRDRDEQKGRRRLLLFLPALGAILVAVLLVTAPLPGRPSGPFSYDLVILLAPSIVGIAALILLNLKSLLRLTGKTRLLALALLFLFAALILL